MNIKINTVFILFFVLSFSLSAQNVADKLKSGMEYTLRIKDPGSPATSVDLHYEGSQLKAQRDIPVSISYDIAQKDDEGQLNLTIRADADAYFNLQGTFSAQGLSYENAYLYMPGFWYRKNLRSPENAPSARLSHNWIVREDRLSSPLVGIYDRTQKVSYTLARVDKIESYALTPLQAGEVVLSGPSDLGSLGFGEANDQPYLTFSYPYKEAPYRYYRKLSMGDPVTAFMYLKKGEEVNISYILKKAEAADYAVYVQTAWTASFDLFQPKPITTNKLSDDEIKHILTDYFKQSFVEANDLKGFSGSGIKTQECEVRPILEVGFVGRVLLNAFNALEYAEIHQDSALKDIAYAVLDSYEKHGFADNGFFRETINAENNTEANVYSIRRQSEGIYSILFYLDYEKSKGRSHPEYEKRIKNLLDIVLTLQKEDGSYPRKFRGNLDNVDATGGSSPSAVLPLVMAYKYFGDKKYLKSARKVVDYLDTEIISKSDYFSSTLDANCEDKEASLYAATALYYMAMVTKGKEKARYVELAKQVAYFTLSWYYTWDVPFAQGQMLGDLGLKSRGWGNVSVENNHIDVFIFEFDEVLDWLAAETGEQRFSDFAAVIKSSMREQLLPYEDHMCGIGKTGYYPEVVQHTSWDYGHYGKGFYNLIFAPGWTVASIWELLTVGRTEDYFKRK